MNEHIQPTSHKEHAAAWYAVQVKRFQERRVVRYLAVKSITTFLPLIEAIHRHKGMQGASRLEPLFPGYLFVRLLPLDVTPDHWHLVQWTPGLRRILGVEETPVPMPAGAIEAIQTRIGELGFVRPGVQFAPGARVRFRSGPLDGLEGIFDQPMSRGGRVRVLLELLGQVRRAEVDELDLESA